MSEALFRWATGGGLSSGVRTAAIAALLLVALGAPSAGAQTASAETPDGAYTLRGRDSRIEAGIDLIYQLRFAEADRHFGRMIEAQPDNPLGHFFLAMVTWWRVLVDLDDTGHDAEFYDLVERCIRVCDRRLDENPMDFDAILFKGGAIGFRGRLRGDRGQFVKAAGDGLKALPLLRKSRQLEPTNRDILFGQGIYNYFAAVMPQRHAMIRPLMVLLPDGDRQLGLQQLREVASEGRYARAEAAYFLAQIYRVFEEDDRTALACLDELYARYSENAVFHLRRARTLADLGRWQLAAPLYEEYVSRSLAGQTGYHVHGQLEAHFYLGKYHFYRSRIEAAAAAFVRADSLARDSRRDDDLAFAALASLMLGMARDLQGEREEARACYRRVLRLPGQGDSRDRAGRYLRHPYAGQD